MSHLILVRHGQSEWNLENKFTGWVDVELAPQGKLEACKAGEFIKKLNLEIKHFYTSYQLRSIDTLKLILNTIRVKPNNIINQNLLFSDHKINIENTKLSFFIFISFFISVFFLSSLLLLDNINFENSFKISMLTLTNTVSSGLYGLNDFSFVQLLTSSKIFIIIFMIIAKIELISIFLLIKNFFFKN